MNRGRGRATVSTAPHPADSCMVLVLPKLVKLLEASPITMESRMFSSTQPLLPRRLLITTSVVCAPPATPTCLMVLPAGAEGEESDPPPVWTPPQDVHSPDPEK